ncbi:type I secretion system permease/ATPase [Loktanella sp. DJP18]|uniref:type I secretion system permease/ATPase n=1 Tax=Loktanella sp. DJP18 TaxID=3409788 RepID=UPI003BB4CAF3
MSQPSARTSSDRAAYRTAWAGLRPVLISVAAISALINVLMLTGSIYMLQVYDRVLASGSVPTLVGLFIIVVILYAFLGFYDFLRARMLARAAVGLDRAVAGDVCQAYLRSGIPGAQAGGTAGASAQPMRDLDTVRAFLGGPGMQGLFDIPFTPLFLGVLFLIHPWLGLLTLAGSAVVAGATVLNRIISRGHMDQTLALDAAARDFADSGKRAVEAAIAMGMDRTLTARWQDMHEAALAAGQRSSDPAETLSAFSKAFRLLLQSAILTLGAYLVLRGEISAGMIIASSILSGRALAPVDQAIGQLRAITGTRAAHVRLRAHFDAQRTTETRMDLPRPVGRLAVRGLTKLAPGPNRPDRARLLTHVGFDLAPGDGLGVIGNSASGKSTLARLLVGAWQPDGGEVRLDGATLDQWDNTALGRHIGYMPQTIDLLPGTVRENIARFDPEATVAKIIAAARMAGVHEMILRLDKGYDTRLGGAAGNTALSGGQIQRLGLARAVYGDPVLVVLDEPNSNLDADGDEALCAAILALRKAGTTVVVMAHRPSAIAAVNRLMVLKDGTVAHCGDKGEVLNSLRAAALQAVPDAPAAPAAADAVQQPAAVRPRVPDPPPAAQATASPAPWPAPLPQARPAAATVPPGSSSTANLKKLFAVERQRQRTQTPAETPEQTKGGEPAQQDRMKQA